MIICRKNTLLVILAIATVVASSCSSSTSPAPSPTSAAVTSGLDVEVSGYTTTPISTADQQTALGELDRFSSLLNVGGAQMVRVFKGSDTSSGSDVAVLAVIPPTTAAKPILEAAGDAEAVIDEITKIDSTLDPRDANGGWFTFTFSGNKTWLTTNAVGAWDQVILIGQGASASESAAADYQQAYAQALSDALQS